MVRLCVCAFTALMIVALLAGCAVPPPEPVAVQPVSTDTPIPPTSTPSPTNTATVTPTPTATHTFTPTITLTPTLSPTLDAIQSLIASGDFAPYEGREMSITTIDGVEFVTDQFGIKYFEKMGREWVETDDNTRLGHFFEFTPWNKTMPEEIVIFDVVDSFFEETYGAKFFNGAWIGVRMESPPRIERVQAVGTEVDLLIIDVFMPNGLNGVGGRFTVLVDAVPAGGKTYLERASNTSDPNSRYPTGSPYGTNSVGVSTEAFSLKEKASKNMFQQPGRPVRMFFATDVQKKPIEPWKYKWAPPRTDNFKIRYIQEVLLQDPEYRNQLADFKKQLIDMQKKGWAVLVKMQKESGGDNVNIDSLDPEFVASLRIDIPEGLIVPATDFLPISTRD
jgi:hypothetical protein